MMNDRLPGDRLPGDRLPGDRLPGDRLSSARLPSDLPASRATGVGGFTQPMPPLEVRLAVAAVLIGLTAAVRLWLNARDVLPVGYSVPLILFLWLRDRRLLWTTAAAFAAIAVLDVFVVLPDSPDVPWVGRRWVLLVVMLLDVIVVGAVVHVLIHALARLVNSNLNLEATNAELAVREEEVARQNEELQSQTEELERQSEELRVANEELSRREKMLEALLGLSRSLAAETSRSETMTRICQTLGELVNLPGVAAAITERRGEELVILCHHGFGPEGPDVAVLPYRQSFASLVLDRGRTGYLADVALRPDLRVPQPRGGRRLQSVLAAPLRVGGRSVGSLELYSVEKHGWSDEQINLVESLAAQTSISLQASELFERIDEERRRTKAVLDTVLFGVAICEPDCTHIRFNPAGAALLNVAPDTPLSVAALRARWRMYREGAELEPRDWSVFRAAAEGIETPAEEIDVVFNSGRRVTLLQAAAPVRDRNGRIIGAVSAFADITRQRALQQELDARRREAEEGSVRKSRFLAAVSHDIRTPANAISLLAELVERSAASPALAGEVPELAGNLKRSAMTLVDLVTDVLDLTRYEGGHIELQESEFPLASLLREECAQFEPLARDRGLGFRCEPVEGVVVYTDRIKLARVIGNLIGNAVKFTETGGVTVSVALPPEGGVAIHVHDTGPGIPPEAIERIFDEFFQLRNPGRDSSKGSGLGLAICRRLMDALGGQLKVHSAVGQGSTFSVLLPPPAVVSR